MTTDIRSRVAAFDALKAGLTLLVVLHHAALTYGADGPWFYREVEPDGSPQSIALVIFCVVNQAYFMGLFFLIAGYFTPGAIERKGPFAFLRDRLVRLGIPLLIFGFILGPITVAMAAMATGANFVDTLLGELRRGAFYQGPLWFAQALLIFSVVAVALHVWEARRFKQRGDVAADHERPACPSAATLLALAVATGAAAFFIRLRWPVGVNVWGLQLSYFATYVVLYVLGCLAANGRRLENIPANTARTLKWVAWVSLPTLLPLALLSRRFAVFASDPRGGWNVPSLMYAMWEPLVAGGIIVSLLQFCLRHFRQLSPPLSRLARRAYCIYIIHPVVLVAICVAARDLAWAPLLKFSVFGGLACVGCYYLSGWILRLPYADRVV